MAQSGLDLPPASRQDIISALLNDYGNSFGGDNSSPRGYSPLPTPKNLPPTPLEYSHAQSSMKDKPLPPLVRMSMRFQLRVDDPPSPGSPDGSRSSTDSQPKKIVSRRLTRSSKPPSLKLTVSNGSTAIVPATPSLPQSSSVLAAKSQDEGKALPPPPPPEKSERRQQRQEPAGDMSIAERPPRKDSLGSQSSESAGPMKRKPLPKFTSLAQLGNGPRGGKGGPLPPAPRLQKQSLDVGKDHGNSGRSASAIETSTTRKKSDDLSEEQTSNQRSFSAVEKPSNTKQSQESPNESVAMPPEMEIQEEDTHRTIRGSARQLPPTPDEIVIPAPPPKKPFGGMGLPSNPRAKGQHSRGKSSTGFNLMKSSKAVSEPQAPIVETITPDPTPSPGRTEEAQARPASPTSSVRDTSERRPFSFEAILPHGLNHTKSEAAAPPPPPKPEAAPAPQKEEVKSAALPPHVPQNPYSPIPTLEAQNTSQPFQPRTTSRNSPVVPTLPVEQQPQEQQSSLTSSSGSSSRIPPAFASLPSQQRLQQKSPAPQASMPSRVPLAFASLPSQQRFRDDEDDSATPPPVKDAPSEPQSSATSTQKTVARDEAPTSPPPFTPLTRHPVDQPAPPLASKQLYCYSYHATFVWSRNTFQPMACMVCKVNDKERKWSCVWCHLRICVACSTELMKIPGRNLKTLVESRGVDVVIQGEQGSTDQTATSKQMRRDDMKRHDSGAGGTVGTPTVVVWGAEDDYNGHDFS